MLKTVINAMHNRVVPIRASVLIIVMVAVLSAGVGIGLHFASADPVSANIEPSTSNGNLSTIFTPEVLHWAPLIKAWGQAYAVDPNLVATVIQIESCGDMNAVSTSGAQGLFQVMPMHFVPGEDMLDVTTNGRRGMEYLAQGVKLAGGDAGLALAGYNGGHSIINSGRVSWSSETQRYFQWGVGIYNDAVSGRPSSAALQAWLNAGGARLCQAAQSHQSVALK